MDCVDRETELFDYHFAVGSQEKRDAVRAHLRDCADCAQHYLDIKHDIDSGAAMSERPSELAHGKLRAEVMTLFRPRKMEVVGRWLSQPTPRYRVGAAMAAMVAIFAVLLIGGNLLSPRMPASSRNSERHDDELTAINVRQDSTMGMLPPATIDTARVQAVSLTFY